MSADGSAAICPRTPSDKSVGDAGWLHRLGDMFGEVSPTPPLPVQPEEYEPDEWWSMRAQDCHKEMQEYQWQHLEEQTKCKRQGLAMLEAGWSAKKSAYTFPMRDSKGRVIGIRLRYPNGSKSSVKTSRNGLFFCPSFDPKQRVFVTEGPTDTAALLGLGLQAVGRPSCNSGGAALSQLLGYGAKVVVVADCDKPGREGANKIAATLKRTCRTIRVIEPLRGSDACDWVADGATADVVNCVADQASEWKDTR